MPESVNLTAAGRPYQYELLPDNDGGLPFPWRVEQEDPEHSAAEIHNGRLIMDTSAGMTVWLNQPLRATYCIQYRRQILQEGKANDRLSDLNQFWAASDPGNANLFTRRGVLQEYDRLSLYYVGMGGNGNTTTRFRHYNGWGDRILLGEYLEREFLLQSGHIYHVRIDIDHRETRFWIDNRIYFRRVYSAPPVEGYFGFRSVLSRQVISDFSISPL